MYIFNPVIFDHIKTIDGDVLRPELVVDTNISVLSKSTNNVVFKQQSDNKYILPHALVDTTLKPFALKIIDIGGWNMDLDTTKSVAHAISPYKSAYILAGFIWDDGHATTMCCPGGYVSTAIAEITFRSFGSVSFSIDRRTGGYFDSVSYDDTGVSRGYVLVLYEL